MSYQSAYRGAGYQRANHPYLYVDPTSVSPSSAVTYVAIALIGGYLLVHQLDLFPTLPLNQLFWNTLVYVTPPSLVVALESRVTSSSSPVDSSQSYAKARTFAAKSEAMRRMLGLSGNGLSYSAGRSRSLSGLGMMFKHTSANSLPGLGNWDNSCYQNSILQGLSALPSLRAFLEQTNRGIPGAASRTTNLALTGLVDDLNNPKNLGKKFWTPAVLKSMSSWQQQDAQEYYSKVIDAMEKELGKSFVLQIGAKGLESQPSKEKDSAEFNSIEKTDDLLRNPLEGMLAQRVGCLRCGYVEGLSLIPFNCLTVPLGNRSAYELAGCIDEYTALEPISGVECARCTLLRQKEILEKLLQHKTQPAAKEKGEDNDEPEQNLSEETGAFTEGFGKRLAAVNEALEGGDYSDTTLSKKCSISSKQRVLVTKTRQAVIARQPQALVVHVNRSVFDEYTGALRKNYADVRFPKFLDLSRWSLGQSSDGTEEWSSNPAESILDRGLEEKKSPGETNMDPQHRLDSTYIVRAVVSHLGRHENGHYIAYRQNQAVDEDGVDREQFWFRLSDEDVTATNEEAVLSQGGVFMLFYEKEMTATEKAEYENTLLVTQSGAGEAHSMDEQEDILEVPDPDTELVPRQEILKKAELAATTPDPETCTPSTVSHSVPSSLAQSATLLAIDPDITPPRKSSLKPGQNDEAKSPKDAKPRSPTQSPSRPSASVSREGDSTLSPPNIPERKASKATKCGKKSKANAEGPYVSSMRTSATNDSGNPSPLGSPQASMVSAN